MDTLWNIDYDKPDLKAANELIQIQCEKLAELTDGMVIARIIEYKGNNYRTYSLMHEFNNQNIFGGEVKDPQAYLGDNDENSAFVYEFYITSIKTPKYKYRVCFIYFSIGLYPVGLTIDKSIAISADLEGTEFEIEDQEGFENKLGCILGCEKVTSIIKNLLNINK